MNNKKSGTINALIAYTLRGIYPLYWHLLQQVGATEIFINRMLWSFVTLGFVVLIIGKINQFKEALKKVFTDKQTMKYLLIATILLGLNWYIFAYAVVSGRLIEASLGYYINPLLSVTLGFLFLKEKMNKLQKIGTLFAFIGVLYLTFTYGVFPWLSLMPTIPPEAHSPYI